jgi:lipopolysaccharide transport system ATP-binding protein
MSVVIKVEQLSKAYQLGQISSGNLTQDIERWWKVARGKPDPFLKLGESNDRSTKGNSDMVWSLKNIDFEIEQGQAVGIIGKNGAGKSTLLKVLSQVTSPTMGQFKVKGRIASLLEVGTGFHPELTGRENIFLNGAILGMRKKEISSKFDEIVDFAGVERYIDTPVKRYSSGMYVRLAFAVAAHLESEILIVDEVLAVGDADFQKKCLGKMGSVSKNEGRTILFVSHNLASLMRLCQKGILLKNGEMASYDSIQEVVGQYAQNESEDGVFVRPNTEGDEVNILKVEVINSVGDRTNTFDFSEEIFLRFELEKLKIQKHSSIFVMILDASKRRIFPTETILNKEKETYTLKINRKFLTRGSYSIHVMTHIPNLRAIDELEDICRFTVVDNTSELSIHGGYDYGSVFGQSHWN